MPQTQTFPTTGPSLRGELFALGLSAAIVVAATLSGAPQALGAHPWWAGQAGLIGTAGGLAIYAVLRLAGVRPGRLGMIAAPILFLSAGAAHFGGQRFAASFASDALAGRAWHFGWFGIAGAAAIVLTVLALRLLRR